MKPRIGLFLLLLAIAGIAGAQSAREMRGEVQASMLVTGYLDVGREGQVTGHGLDQPDQLPPYLVDFVSGAIPQLRFEPVVVDGEPVQARAKMTLRLVARHIDDDLQISIRSAHFGDEDSREDTGRVRSVKRTPPRYPPSVATYRGQGTVYLIVKVGRDGSAEDVVVEQTNLAVLRSAREMEWIRANLERAALAAARNWRFATPTTGESVGDSYWPVRVPVEFRINGWRGPGYGEWAAYHPGPRTRPDWAEEDAPGFNPDLLAAGGTYQAGSRFRLLTPLGG